MTTHRFLVLIAVILAAPSMAPRWRILIALSCCVLSVVYVFIENVR